MIPNWKRNGFMSREEGMLHVFKCLKEQEKEILKAGILGFTEFQYGGKTFILGNYQEGGSLLKLKSGKKQKEG